MEPTGKRKWWYVALASAGPALLAVAAWTNAIDTIAAWWQSWDVGRVLTMVAPWLVSAVTVYCATALLITAYRGWRGGKRARERQLQSEIVDLAGHLKYLIGKIEEAPKPAERREPDIEHALTNVKEALVRASMYEYRLSLFTRINNMEKKCLNNPNGPQEIRIEQFLEEFRQWIAYAESVPNFEAPTQPNDPFAPQGPYR